MQHPIAMNNQRALVSNVVEGKDLHPGLSSDLHKHVMLWHTYTHTYEHTCQTISQCLTLLSTQNIDYYVEDTQ